jgi:hypothetical protein
VGQRLQDSFEIQLDAKALMVIASLCPISVEGVIRGLRWGIGPEGSKALSSHHIWTFIPSVGGVVCMYGRTDIWTYGCTDIRTYGRTDVRMYGRTDVRTHGRTDVRTYGRMDVRNERP